MRLWLGWCDEARPWTTMAMSARELYGSATRVEYVTLLPPETHSSALLIIETFMCWTEESAAG